MTDRLPVTSMGVEVHENKASSSLLQTLCMLITSSTTLTTNILTFSSI